MNRRAWLVGSMALALVAAAGVAFLRSRHDCGADVTSLPASRSSSPFLDARERRNQPDHDRDQLVRTLAADPPPIGRVVGAVGCPCEQWAQVSAYAQGIGVRTRDNPDFTMLDDRTLRPRWSVEVRARHSTYDASEQRYLVATMPSGSGPDLVALDARNGSRIWCTTLQRTVHGSDPFATQFLEDQDVAVLGPASGSKERVQRLSAQDGHPLWQRTLDADSGDFLGDMGNGTLLAGGRPAYELFDPAALRTRREGVALVLLSARDGSTTWTGREPAGTDVHVLGTDPVSGHAVVERASTRATSLQAIDGRGRVAWSVSPARGGPFDAALRFGRVLVRAGNRWSAYAAADGRRLWTRAVPDRPQFLPYGFELDSIPMLDGDHALVGGTTGLHTLNLATGTMRTAPLPTDGINTTYWPYQVAVSDRLIAVATNTGAVVVRRE